MSIKNWIIAALMAMPTGAFAQAEPPLPPAVRALNVMLHNSVDREASALAAVAQLQGQLADRDKRIVELTKSRAIETPAGKFTCDWPADGAGVLVTDGKGIPSAGPVGAKPTECKAAPPAP